ncbi:unnamed protein product [Onchocerca flexuosa]|uniref:Uncharacterized protein n=1 Tax=Onchocerca flexuosa TaxID=387005 RepID=A0A183HP36_9BILA|nr:unnamed protein product [Onchocerca flexuosa]
MLLDSTSIRQLEIVNGVAQAVFRNVRQALNLLENDRHWDASIIRINDECNTPHPIPTLFKIILSTQHSFGRNTNRIWLKVFSIE